MNLFRSYVLTWWQVGVLKLALLSFGIAIGAYWHDFFGDYIIGLIIIGLILGLYAAYVSFSRICSSFIKNGR